MHSDKQVFDSQESPFKGKRGLRRLINALWNSIEGFKAAYEFESAFRQVLLLAACMLPIALFVPVTAVERVLLIGTVLGVLVVELLNSSVEAAVDRIGLEEHSMSKRAKDLGSAAVLISLVIVSVTWAVILIPLVGR